jgi:predicted ATPase
VQTILAKVQGNPFFLEEIVQALVEQGVLGQGEAGGAAACAPFPSEIQLPPTVQGVLTARLDRLPPEEKALLQTLAVIGTVCPWRLLTQVVGQPEEALRQPLGALQAAEFLYEQPARPEPTYHFKHVLTQEAAYASLMTERRRMLHERTAQVLEAFYADRLEEHYGALAHHYRASGNAAKAVTYLQQAGQQALQCAANTEAIQHLTAGLTLLATLPETPMRVQQELDMQIALGPALFATKGHAAPEVEQTYARARALCQQVGETPQLFRTLLGLCWFYINTGALQTAQELGEQLCRLTQHEVAPLPRLEAHDALGSALYFLGDYAAAWTHLEQGMALIDPTAPRALVLRYGMATGVWCLAIAANVRWCLGYPVQAMRLSQEALDQAQALDQAHGLAIARLFAAILHHRCRDALAVREQAEALLALVIAQELLPRHFAGYGTGYRGWALAMQGQEAEGLAQMRQGLAAVLATGQALSWPLCPVLLAGAAGHAGEVEEGLRRLAEALAAFEASQRGDMRTEAYRLQGEFLLRQAAPDAPRAEACFQQALAVARRQQAKSWELRAAISLARLWQQQGRRAKACKLLAPIYGWFTEGFDTADLQEAKALLEELGG